MNLKKDITKDLLLFILAAVFSVALMFAFIELPRWFESLLSENVGFPGFDHGSGEEESFKSEIFIEAFYLRWIGYTSLVLVVIFIVIGFITRKSSWGWAGALVIFLPVFGQFAISMFFLAGLGILRTGWLPFIESAFPILDLGKVIYLPYWILMWFFSLFDWYAKNFLCWLFMTVGAFLFVWGVFVWIQSRFKNKGVASGWIYKISRHPQYLGWIIWSYGLMLFSITENDMKKSWGFDASFPWLIMTMIIIAICMLEELSMHDKYGEDYDEYRRKTPFLLPLPVWLKAVIKVPSKLVTNKKFPENEKQVAGITLIYTVIFVLFSLIWVDFKSTTVINSSAVANPEKVIDSLNTIILTTTERRVLSGHFYALGNLGKSAVDQLIVYLNDEDAVKREFASNQLGRLKDTTAVWALIGRLNDDVWRVRNSAMNALSDIGDKRAIDPIMELLENASQSARSRYYGLLGNLKVENAWPYLVEGLNDERWYIKNAALNSLAAINFIEAKPYIYNALKDTDFRIRRKAVSLIMETLPADATEPLKLVLDDEDFETRFYANQALKSITQK